ncbi:MAG: DEAD/DEAH box helicase [archaeon]|nr:DEAD/DEAH box helicase [archaeon]
MQAKIEQLVLDSNGFASFNPMQKAVLEKGLNKSLIISSPTASGKTIALELFALQSILSESKKVIYCCPLRALASEHFNDFKKKYSEKLKIKATLSTGDFDSSSKYLANYDIIYTTFEKCDSLTRHKADWLKNIGLLVLDEVHEIDSSRGPVIELIVTKLKLLNPKIKILALSATIPNAKELSEWLDTELVSSDFRPVTLHEGVYFNETIKFPKKEVEVIEFKDDLSSLINDTLLKQKQALVFCSARRISLSTAKKLSSLTKDSLSLEEKAFLKKESLKALNVLESPTEQCRILASLIEEGIAFHNAGLLTKQRHIVEELFRNGHLQVLCATSTLFQGVNLPAFRVIIPSLYRYGNLGSERIPVREFKQICGRAGRPKFHEEGEGIIIARNELEVDELMEDYILGEIEPVNSKLGIEPVLRMHLLSSIASNFVFDLESLEKFFSQTFYAFQYKNLEQLFIQLNSLLKELQEMGFIESNEKSFKATLLGKRISELYLDPLSAFKIVNYLKKENISEFGTLFLLNDCFELMPLLNAPAAKEAELWEQIQDSAKLLSIDLEKQMFFDQDLLEKFFSAQMFDSWINEVQDDVLAKDFKIQPGILHSKLKITDWLVYCCHELTKLLKKEQHIPILIKLRKRLKHGVKEELVLLTELKGIGRVRGRRLFNAGFKRISDLKQANIVDLARILGQQVAVSLKQQLGEKNISKETLNEIKLIEKQGQSDLTQF